MTFDFVAVFGKCLVVIVVLLVGQFGTAGG